ncbi:CBU_0592 family membrane protein [Dactylosporangium fulvum]|uniref:CBU-0592-like domain-containing protein n=1 Tax=Dactylosporangium fulvum TaxID=53359 RepID=A0ABY5W600_9ACTN|nr:hypothetical protein [Dactylosporangium fulvum]UWP84894.1 hypothetical protein Dfulv_11955 [Dactylosporangium fulvum]
MSSQFLISLIGWLGAAALVAAYALVSSKRLAGDGAGFQLMNISGAVALAFNSAVNGAWPSAVLNIVWVGIGGVAMFKLARRRRIRQGQVRGAAQDPAQDPTQSRPEYQGLRTR